VWLTTSNFIMGGGFRPAGSMADMMVGPAVPFCSKRWAKPVS